MEITLNKEANEPKEAGAFQYELRIDGTPSGWAYRVAACAGNKWAGSERLAGWSLDVDEHVTRDQLNAMNLSFYGASVVGSLRDFASRINATISR